MLIALCASAGWAQQAAEGEELVEKVVVRNRLFNVEGRFEIGVNVGISMLSRLTDHYNFNASGAYNFMDSLAAELRVGYAYSAHTSLADDISGKFFGLSKTSVPEATDLTDLWELKFNAIAGLRWQPVYGKLGLMAELPVHFQFYLWLGGGVGMLERKSVVICNQEGIVVDPVTGKNVAGCVSYLTDSKINPLGSFALGFRFFITDNHVFRFEVRDWLWFDNYTACASRTKALESGNPTGTGDTTPSYFARCPTGVQERSGLTNLVQLDLGYQFIF